MKTKEENKSMVDNKKNIEPTVSEKRERAKQSLPAIKKALNKYRKQPEHQ